MTSKAGKPDKQSEIVLYLLTWLPTIGRRKRPTSFWTKFLFNTTNPNCCPFPFTWIAHD